MKPELIDRTTERRKPVKLALAAIAAAGSISLAVYQYNQTRPPKWTESWGLLLPHETDDGRQLLWASGPRDDVEAGEWFDVTGSPLDPKGYQYGIGKDTIRAIDQPVFISIQHREELREHDIDEQTAVIGYVHNGEAKAYPIPLLDRHEVVNDMVGGKPVTVGW